MPSNIVKLQKKQFRRTARIFLTALLFILGISCGQFVQAQNRPPVANADTFTTHGNWATPNESPNPSGVLKNDTDPDVGDVLTAVYSRVDIPDLGTAIIFYNGVAYFQPLPGRTGTATIPYTVCDNHGACASSTVTFNVVNSPPSLIADTFTVHGVFATPPEQPLTGLLKNDTDPENDVPLSTADARIETPLGTALIGSSLPGYAGFVAALGQTGSITVPYTACDSLGACASSTVTFNVVNNLPIARSDYYEVIDDAFATSNNSPNPSGLLINDSDPDEGDYLRVSDQRYDFPEGTILIFNTGGAAYVRAQGSTFAGAKTVAYTVCDNLGGCSQGKVTFNVHPKDGAENAGEASCNARRGNPVNVTNGNMYLSQTDYNLPGTGENILINRFYNSIIPTSGLFGKGFSTQYDEAVIAYGNQLLRVNMPDGRAQYFSRENTTLPFTATGTDTYGKIVKNADNSYTLTFKDGSIHQFNQAGKLLLLKDRNNNQTTLNYNASNQLTGLTDAFGRVLTVTPNANGTIAQLADSLGTVANYAYNTDNTLQNVTYPDGSQYKFEYTTLTVNGVTRPYLTIVRDALNNILEKHEYDANGRAVTSEIEGGQEKYTFDYTNAAYTTVTDGLGRITKYYFDTSRGRNVVTKTEGNCSCGGGGSEVTQYFYDERLNKIKIIDANNNETNYTYDSQGNRLTLTDVLGTETYTYNNFGEILTAKDRMNGITTNTFNSTGNLLTTTDALGKVTTLTYNSRGQILTAKDARNQVTTLAYDTLGRLSTVKDANLGLTTRTYDTRSRLLTQKNALNYVTTFGYDLNNRINKITYPDAKFVQYGYDLAGRRTALTDEKGNVTTYGYDGAYRMTTQTDALTHSTSYGYDAMSNRTSMTDALGNITNYEYDEFNRLKKIVHPSSTTGAVRLEETIEYDLVGNVKKRTDTAGRATLYDYDSSNRLWKTTDADLKVTQFEYNARSQMTAVTDALTQRYDFTYDALGRQLSQTRAGSVMTYEYDAVENRTKRTDYLNQVTNYSYDNLNRLTNITYPDATENVTLVYDAISQLTKATKNAQDVTFIYDKRHRATSTTDVFGKVVAMTYTVFT